MADDDKRFKITYCTSCGFQDRAVQLSDELEKDLKEQTLLVPSEGGMFEVEDKNVTIFSKLETGRFPEEGEVKDIIANIAKGMELTEAKKAAAQEHGHGSGLIEWVFGLFRFQ
jgi:selenoprotein W-related protein